MLIQNKLCHSNFGFICKSGLRMTINWPKNVTTYYDKIQHNYFYSKTNRMHNISNLFYFETTFYMFRTVSPSSMSLRLYIQHQVYVIQVLWLLASGNEMEHLLMMDGETVRNM